MLRPLYSAVRTRRLAFAAQTMAAQGDVLFHGTRCPLDILRDQRIRLPEVGDHAVSLTRSARVAAYWAMLPRDEPLDEWPAILVLDRDRLRSRYRVTPHNYFGSPPYLASAVQMADEMEERVVDRDTEDVFRYLKGLVVFGLRPLELAELAAAAPGLLIKPVTRRSVPSRFVELKTDAQLELAL